MRRARIIALVAVPVLLFGAGCRGDVDSDGSGGSSGSGGSAEQQFEDIESTLRSIESEMAEEGR
ncbi:MAG: hypothetical protein ACRDSK_15040 [Actinophytocola sp.]|uniref:hypothetical protein n=1 Tax=Actinophytocola sp. TaxID=1872138 RepID=UPI003D6AAE3C